MRLEVEHALFFDRSRLSARVLSHNKAPTQVENAMAMHLGKLSRPYPKWYMPSIHADPHGMKLLSSGPARAKLERKFSRHADPDTANVLLKALAYVASSRAGGDRLTVALLLLHWEEASEKRRRNLLEQIRRRTARFKGRITARKPSKLFTERLDDEPTDPKLIAAALRAVKSRSTREEDRYALLATFRHNPPASAAAAARIARVLCAILRDRRDVLEVRWHAALALEHHYGNAPGVLRQAAAIACDSSNEENLRHNALAVIESSADEKLLEKVLTCLQSDAEFAGYVTQIRRRCRKLHPSRARKSG